MKRDLYFKLQWLFLFLGLAYLGGAVLLYSIFGPIETRWFGMKFTLKSLKNPLGISLGFFLLGVLLGRHQILIKSSALSGRIKRWWRDLFTGGGLTADNRIHWIDNLRTLAIFFMVFAHTSHVKAEIRSEVIYIYSFHMPLFFFISGLTLNLSKYKNWEVFLRKKISTLLVPYFFFSLLGYGLFLTSNYQNFSLANLADSLYKILYADTDLLAFAYDGPLWFLPCLFLIEVEFYFISRLKPGVRIGLIFFLVCVGLVFGPRFRYIPWTAAASWVALVFYWLGFLLKDQIAALNSSLKIPLLVLGLLINAGFCYLNGPVSMAIDYYGNPFYFLLSALGGIIFWTLLTTYSRPNRILTVLGMNTIIILGLHGSLLFFLFPRLEIITDIKRLYALIPFTDFQWLNTIIDLFNASFISIFFTLFQIGLIFLLIPIFNRKLYICLGRKKPNPGF